MTTAELAAEIGTLRDLCVETDLTIKVLIQDARTVYGRTDYLVTPLHGEGQQWVSAVRVD